MPLMFSKLLAKLRICNSFMLFMIIVYLTQCCLIFWKKISLSFNSFQKSYTQNECMYISGYLGWMTVHNLPFTFKILRLWVFYITDILLFTLPESSFHSCFRFVDWFLNYFSSTPFHSFCWPNWFVWMNGFDSKILVRW